MTRLILCALAALAIYGMADPVAAADLVRDGVDWLYALARR